MKPKEMALTAEELRELFLYEPETGIMSRRIAVGRRGRHRAGTVVGCGGKGEHLTVRVGGYLYLLHRLIWLYMTGLWPKHQIDHINMIRDDNRWCNLREATHGQNVVNSRARAYNVLGLKGVHRRPSKFNLRKPYEARITANGVVYSLGYFKTAQEAHEAYVVAAKMYFGEFARAS